MKFIERRKGPPEVPIIPMIDILSILLVFFIVYTERKTERPVIRPELPGVSNLASEKVAGSASILAVSGDGSAALDGREIDSLQQLAEYLKRFKQENPERRLELELDQGLPLGKVIFVWEALTESGYPVKAVPLRVRKAMKGQPSPTE